MTETLKQRILASIGDKLDIAASTGAMTEESLQMMAQLVLDWQPTTEVENEDGTVSEVENPVDYIDAITHNVILKYVNKLMVKALKKKGESAYLAPYKESIENI